MISYRSEVDGIRAIAIASVVLFHGWGSAFPGGYVGVDIFFVISGYLITSIIFKEMKEGSFTYLNFYERRARRILPAFFAMIFVSTIAVFLFFLPDNIIEYGKILIYTLLFGSNFRLGGELGYFHQSMQDNPLLHMWSLSVEEQFYLLWPTILALMIRFLPEKKYRLAVLGLCLVSLVAAEVLVHIWPRSAFFHLPTRGWELLVGALLAMGFVPRTASKAVAEALSAIGLALMIAPLFLFDKETPFPGLAALVPVLGCALVIYATENERTRVAALLSLKPIVFLGLISYSLYLWHWPVLAIANYELSRPLSGLEALFCMLAAGSAAIFSWRFIEKPFRRRRAQRSEASWRSRARWAFIPSIGRAGQFAVVLSALLIASGSFFQELKGVLWRFPPEVRDILAKVTRDFPSCTGRQSGPLKPSECQFGDEPGDLVLWGDSHAQHYLPLIANVFGGGTAYLTPGCLPVANAQLNTKSGSPVSEGCLRSNRHAMEQILATKPQVVVMASRWAAIEDRPPYALEALYLVDDKAETTHEASRRTFAHAINETVSTLTAAGIKVVLMGQVPEMLLPPAHCFAPFKKPNWGECGVVARTEANRRQLYIDSTLSTAEDNLSGVFFFSPSHEFCDDVYCYAIKDRKLRYYDTNHLNVHGSLALVDAFRKALPEPFHLPNVVQSFGRPETGTRRG